MENYGNNGLVPNIGEVGNITTNVEEKSMFGDYGKNTVKDIFEDLLLVKYFFHKIMLKIFKSLIRYRVYQQSNKKIDRQSNNNLIIIMRSIFLQYGDISITTKEALIKEIRNLNDRV